MRVTQRSLMVATATVALSACLAFGIAASTWTVTPGGSGTAKSGKITFTDTTSGSQLTCQSSASGVLKSGSGLAGAGIDSTSQAAFTRCTGPLGLAFTTRLNGLPYRQNALTYSASKGAATGMMTGFDMTLTAPACSAVLDGTAAGADDGDLEATYTNSTGKARFISAGDNLHVYAVSGCAGLLSNGDAVSVSGTYSIAPHQTTTRP